MATKPFAFEFDVRGDRTYAEHFFPHFATDQPIALKLDDAPEGVVIEDIKWSLLSYFVCSGTIDPRLFLQRVYFKFPRPRYMNDMRIMISNLSRRNTKLSGTLYTREQNSHTNISLYPLMPNCHTRYPWKTTINPSEKISFKGRTQIEGSVNEVILVPEHIRDIKQGRLSLKLEAISYAQPSIKPRYDEHTRRELGSVIDGEHIFVTHPCNILAGEDFIVTATNLSEEPIKDFTAAATLRATL